MKQKSFLTQSIPVWLALLITLNASGAIAITEFYLLTKNHNQQIKNLIQLNQNPEAFVEEITSQVLPSDGYTTSLTWGDLGQKLVELGAIDKEKYQEIFNSNTNGQQDLDILDDFSDKPITINENNTRFVVNTLWALGLINKSKVLDEGPMRTGGTPTEKFASTAGWTLGSKPAMQLYSSQELIPLTGEQQALVEQIASNVYRPCCGNHTAFPDCNHGMAALGYIELAVASNLSEEQIYQDLLAFNSYWFPQTYVEMGVYFQKENNTSWENVDPKLALSQTYSSAGGAQTIAKAVQNVPGLKSQGGSCGA